MTDGQEEERVGQVTDGRLTCTVSRRLEKQPPEPEEITPEKFSV